MNNIHRTFLVLCCVITITSCASDTNSIEAPGKPRPDIVTILPFGGKTINKCIQRGKWDFYEQHTTFDSTNTVTNVQIVDTDCSV